GEVTFAVSGNDILIATPEGTIRLADQVRREGGHARGNIERVLLADGELDDAGIRARALADQVLPAGGPITGTPQADRIGTGPGADTIAALGGDDTIVYAGGDDVILGDASNTGFDTLDLRAHAAGEVTFAVSGNDILIATPDGTIRLADQVRRAVGHSRSNIERIVFSDGELDEAGIRARALSDPPPVAAPMAMMAMDVGDGEADGEEGGANMAVALTTGEPAPNGIPVLVAPLPDRIVTATGPFAITLQTGLFSDPDGDALTFSVTLADGGALPGWMAFDAATRTLSGEPPSGATAASVQLRLHASDGQAGISDDFTLRLNVANAAPVLDRPLEDVASQASGQPIRAGSPFRFDIDRAAFRDPDGDPLILSARLADGSPLPGWMVFDGTGFVGLPPAAAAGQIEIAVRATDGLLSVEDRFVLTVA
ncbi:MAG TPA: putative Ig domain-containing protein, partial [Paracoccaceae bacterium]|nr:putative Ig domain-containing protein [Paracoccaceae bacterium]